MNLTQPPFDDIHVRQAMNLVMDKARARAGVGRPDASATSRTTSSRTRCFNNQLADYAPYKTPGDHGSVAKAKAAMKGSKYDTDKNGTCSAKACKNVLLIADTRAVDTKMVPVIEAEREEDRHHLHGRARSRVRTRRSRRRRRTSRSPSARAGARTTPTPLTFFSPLFDGRTIIPNGNTNYSLVGITPGDGEEGRASRATCNGVPSVNARARPVRRPRSASRALTCYDEPRQEADDEGRAVGPVPVVERRPASPSRT